MIGEVTVRPVSLPADSEFLMAVFASSRAAELSMLESVGADTGAFVRMQSEAQTLHYRTVYPHAHESLIVVGSVSAGRLIVDRTKAEIRIVDIALLPHFRGTGVGSELIRRLLAEADASSLPVRCHVAVDNDDGRRFWERLGFGIERLDGAHLAMEHPGATSSG
jgi:ribosomal protein S18 acetylase RimI-like enzyme